jgi:hypothetical protein
MSFVESYTDANWFFNRIAKWMKETVHAEFDLYGNLDKVFFVVHIRSKPVKPHTSHTIPWEPEIEVVWNGRTRRADIRIRWVSYGLMGEQYQITQEIGPWFDFDMFWPRSIPFCPGYMFDIYDCYMGETDEFSESFNDPRMYSHDLEIVPRPLRSGVNDYMLNAAATAEWLELS